MSERNCCRELSYSTTLVRLRHNWRLFVAILAPILLTPIAWNYSSPGADANKKFRAAYVIVLMAVYWVLEVVPLAITSLLPLVLFPLLDIQDAASVSKNYMRESNMIFLGAIILALSIEYCGLHVRLALRVISIFGSNPSRIMLGAMMVAATMSMWISETSCTTMLLPILSAITSAMFREEQEDEVVDPQYEENEGQTEPKNVSSSLQFYHRGRRESHVFANSALTTGPLQSSLRRKSRRSNSSKYSTNPNNAIPSISKTTTQGTESLRSVLDDTAGLDEDKTMREVSSMSVILEGVAVPPNYLGDQPPELPKKEEKKPGYGLKRISEDLELQRNIRKMLLFAVAYSASIGGTGSLVGTGPIKVFKELIKEYDLEKTELVRISFATWMGFNIPPLIVNIFVVWLFLIFRYMGCKNILDANRNQKLEKQKVAEYLREQYKKLGPMSAHEIGVAVIFVSVVLLWLLRDPQVFPGWNSIINSAGAGDSTAAMLGVMLVFVLPKSWSFLNCGRKYRPQGQYEALLDWKFVSANAPWGYILLIGSGYAIADASQKSDLSPFIGSKLDSLRFFSDEVLLLIVMFITSLITEVVSNTACASLILPVLFSVSCRLEIHPIFLTMASAVSASYAFMLPISSPPNAIIFATGELHVMEMLVNGLFLNIVCSLILYVFILTYGNFIFAFSSFDPVAYNLTIYQNCSFFRSRN